jgi:hypothetical protein
VIFKMAGRDDQYDPANTEVVPPAGIRSPAADSREDWQRTVGDEDPSLRALQMIVDAVAE